MENKSPEIEGSTPVNTQLWIWYRIWINALLHPKVATGKALLSEGNISPRQGLIWIVVAFLFYEFCSLAGSLIAWQGSATTQMLSPLLLGDAFLGAIPNIVGFLIFTGLIHFVAKQFNSNGTWGNFVVVEAAFTSPLLILLGLTSIFVAVTNIYFALITLIMCYWLIVICPLAVKSNYGFNWPRTFLICYSWPVIVFISILSHVLKEVLIVSRQFRGHPRTIIKAVISNRFYLLLHFVQAAFVYLSALVAESREPCSFFPALALTAFSVLNPIINLFLPRWRLNTGLFLVSSFILINVIASPFADSCGEGATGFIIPVMTCMVSLPVTGLIRLGHHYSSKKKAITQSMDTIV